MKPWLCEPHGRQLEAFLGVWRVQTSRYKTSEELIIDACILYDLVGLSGETPWTVDQTASAIEALGKKERGIRARANLHLIAADIDNDPSGKLVEPPITQEGLESMLAKSEPQLVDGASQDCTGELDINPAKLLMKIVGAVVAAGQGHILYDFPEVLEFTKSRIPSRSELAGHSGIDERMFEAKAKWPNLDAGAWS
jgi:hypothetical protein